MTNGTKKKGSNSSNSNSKSQHEVEEKEMETRTKNSNRLLQRMSEIYRGILDIDQRLGEQGPEPREQGSGEIPDKASRW
jgi:hypothetical protein